MGVIRLEGRLICTTSDEADRVERHLPEHARRSLAEPGCLEFTVERTVNPLVWSVRETFAGRAALEAHQARAQSGSWADATRGIRRDYTITEAPR